MATVNLKATSKGVIALIAVAGFIFLGCVLGYLGAAGKMRRTNHELDTKEKKVAESKVIAQKLEKSKLDYFDTWSQIRFLETSVSTSAYVPTLLEQLELLGKSVNLKVLGVKPQPPEKRPTVRKITSGSQASKGNVEGASEGSASDSAKGKKEPENPYDELKIEVEVEGNYANMLDFLYKLTSFPKIIAVNTVTMSPVDSVLCFSESPRLTIKLEITAFMFKNTTPAGTPGLPGGPVNGNADAGEGGNRNEAG